LRKYEPACIFCGSADDTFEYEDRTVCIECIEEMSRINKFSNNI